MPIRNGTKKTLTTEALKRVGKATCHYDFVLTPAAPKTQARQ